MPQPFACKGEMPAALFLRETMFPSGYREPPRYKDDRHRDSDYHYKKKKRLDIFDIFD